MSFHENHYLSWYLPRAMSGKNPVNLHSSGVPMVSPDHLDLPDGPANPFETAALFESELAGLQGVSEKEIVFTPGATGGTLLALLTLAQRGSNIIVETPIYEPMMKQAARLAEARPLERTFEGGWLADPDKARRLMDDDTAVVMLTEPHNPSGILTPREDILAIAAAAEERGAYLLINEVYRDFAQSPSFHLAAPNIVVVSSLSKLTGAYWARAGWLGAYQGLAAKFRKAHLNMGIPTAPGALYGLAFLEDFDFRRQAALDWGRGYFDKVKVWIESDPNISWHQPQAVGFGCAKIPVDDMAFAQRLLDDRNVLVVPGTCFGYPKTVRITWLQAGHRLEEGTAAFSDLLARF